MLVERLPDFDFKNQNQTHQTAKSLFFCLTIFLQPPTKRFRRNFELLEKEISSKRRLLEKANSFVVFCFVLLNGGGFCGLVQQKQKYLTSCESMKASWLDWTRE